MDGFTSRKTLSPIKMKEGQSRVKIKLKIELWIKGSKSSYFLAHIQTYQNNMYDMSKHSGICADHNDITLVLLCCV